MPDLCKCSPYNLVLHTREGGCPGPGSERALKGVKEPINWVGCVRPVKFEFKSKIRQVR